LIEIAFDIEDKFEIQLPQTQHEMIAFTYGDLCELVEKNVVAQTNSASSVSINA
jgi:acyl carrier protein